jgi:hypothetical protein
MARAMAICGIFQVNQRVPRQRLEGNGARAVSGPQRGASRAHRSCEANDHSSTRSSRTTNSSHGIVHERKSCDESISVSLYRRCHDAGAPLVSRLVLKLGAIEAVLDVCGDGGRE